MLAYDEMQRHGSGLEIHAAGVDDANRAFRLGFDNGYTVSVTYGPHKYSNDLHGNGFQGKFLPVGYYASAVEVAVIDPQGNWVKFKDGDQVRGRTDMATLLSIFNWVATLPSNSSH